MLTDLMEGLWFFGSLDSVGGGDNGPYFQNKIEKVPFESRQEKKSLIRRKYDIIFSFPNDR